MKCFGIPRSLKRNIKSLYGKGRRKKEAKKRQKDEDLKRIAEKDRKIFSYECLAAATDNFNPALKLGQGGFGSVHKGRLEDGTEIAVKKLSNTTPQGRSEFMKEAELLTLLQHRNVVKLIGYCADNNEYLLVSELLPHSLDQRLFRAKETGKLDWTQINRIIIGIAKGLLYLHCYSRDAILHRDIKPSNILLDHDLEPKITDFGVGRLFDKDKSHVVTRLAGTMGYIAPEYLDLGFASAKTDVYSFGVLVLELISGKRCSYRPSEQDNAVGLLDWAYKLFKAGRILDIMNPALADSLVMEQVANCIEIGLRCTQGNPKSRPDMECVVSMLTGNQDLGEKSVLRPGIYGYRGFHSGDLSAFVEATQSQVDQSESELPVGSEISEIMPTYAHQEATLIQRYQSEAQFLLGPEMPNDMPVHVQQSQHSPRDSNQIMLEDQYSNSNIFRAQDDSAITNHLSSLLEVGADEEVEVSDRTSSGVSMDQLLAESKESGIHELSNSNGSVINDTEPDESTCEKVISKLGAEKKDLDAINAEPEADGSAMTKAVNGAMAMLNEIEEIGRVMEKDWKNYVKLRRSGANLMDIALDYQLKRRELQGKELMIGHSLVKCLNIIERYENGEKLVARLKRRKGYTRLQEMIQESSCGTFAEYLLFGIQVTLVFSFVIIFLCSRYFFF